MARHHGSKRQAAAAKEPPRTTAKRSREAKPVSASVASVQTDVRAFVRKFAGVGGNADADIVQALRRVVQGEAGDDLACCSALRGFIKAYGVPRTFKGMREDNVAPLLPIVKHLQRSWAAAGTFSLLRHCNGPAPINAAVREVEALADACKAAGFARNISFASKALNMLGLRVPLFSSECLAFLQLPRTASYHAFVAKWMDKFGQVRAAYEAASSSCLVMLREGRNGFARSDSGDDSIQELGRELGPIWFAMRGFDATLLRVGGPMRKI